MALSLVFTIGNMHVWSVGMVYKLGWWHTVSSLCIHWYTKMCASWCVMCFPSIPNATHDCKQLWHHCVANAHNTSLDHSNVCSIMVDGSVLSCSHEVLHGLNAE